MFHNYYLLEAYQLRGNKRTLKQIMTGILTLFFIRKKITLSALEKLSYN